MSEKREFIASEVCLTITLSLGFAFGGDAAVIALGAPIGGKTATCCMGDEGAAAARAVESDLGPEALASGGRWRGRDDSSSCGEGVRARAAPTHVSGERTCLRACQLSQAHKQALTRTPPPAPQDNHPSPPRSSYPIVWLYSPRAMIAVCATVVTHGYRVRWMSTYSPV